VANPHQAAAKRLALLREMARRVPWDRIRRQHDPAADLVVWFHHRYPESVRSWALHGDTVLKDVGLLAAVAGAGHRFRLVSGRDIGHVANARVVYSIEAYNPPGLRNYVAPLLTTLRELEAQGNTLYPAAAEAEWWENKVFMHRRFAELGIRTPPTEIVERGAALDEDALTYPLIAKEPHSHGSLGVHRIDGPGALRELRRRLAAEGRYDLLLQQIIDIRRDLRCTLIGGEIVHHYFRINPDGGEWRPTSTRHGSRVDFDFFPERWRAEIVDAFGRTGLRSGAFDVCWDGDDLDTPPYFLEVSPAYTPNPKPPPRYADWAYADYKRRLRGPDSHPAMFVDLVFALQRRVVAAWGLGAQ
jgi:hypothetical protein